MHLSHDLTIKLLGSLRQHVYINISSHCWPPRFIQAWDWHWARGAAVHDCARCSAA